MIEQTSIASAIVFASGVDHCRCNPEEYRFEIVLRSRQLWQTVLGRLFSSLKVNGPFILGRSSSHFVESCDVELKL